MKTGYIYKICCLDPTKDKIYIGSCISIKDRKYKHKNKCNNPNSTQYNKPAYIYIRENGGWNNFDFVIIEKIEFNEKYELHARERYWIENLKASLNVKIPTQTKKENYEKNKEKILEKNKQWAINNAQKNKEYHDKYYRENKEKIDIQKKEYNEENREYFNTKKKEYYYNNKDKWKNELSICECGKEIHGHKSRHLKSQKHIKWVESQNNINK